MKISHIMWLSLCIQLPSFGQTPLDSLKKGLQNIRAEHYPVGEAYQLFQIGFYFYSARQYDSALSYYSQALTAKPTGRDSASALNGIGVVYSTTGSPPRSVPYYQMAIAIYERLRDTANSVTANNNLAIIYKDLGLYDDALEISFKNLLPLEKQPASRTLASSYNTIGAVYGKIQDYEKAYIYYRKALAVRLAIKYDPGVGQSYNNIGELFNDMGQYDSALSNLQHAAEIRTKINDIRGLGRTLTLIGGTLIQSQRPTEGKAKLEDALLFTRTSVDRIGEVAALNGLGAASIALKDYKLAKTQLDEALLLINKHSIKEHLKKNLELHADLYKRTNDKSMLIETLEKIQVVKDSLLNAEKVESLLALEVQYESEKKEQEITTLQQQRRVDKSELDANRTLIVSLSFGAFLISVIAILLYRLSAQSKRQRQSAELHTKEVQHRMKNHLQILSSIFTIQASLLEDKQAQQLVKSTEGRVNAMAILHKKLYYGDEPAELSLKEYITDLTDSILFAYGFDENKLELKTDIVDIGLPIDKTIRIGLILNELITNALKYAYSNQPDPRLQIKISRESGGLCLEIADNGMSSGFSPGKESSFGLKMVQSIVRELKANIQVTNENGMRYIIMIPL